jgi:hypothetical protein
MDKSKLQSNVYYFNADVVPGAWAKREQSVWCYDYPEYTDVDNNVYTNVTVTMNENQIIDENIDWWTAEMIKVGKQDRISFENCIEDWIVSHWAYKKENE